MHDRPGPEEAARATLDAFVAQAENPELSVTDLDALTQQASEAAELLDDLDATEVAERRAQQVDVEALPPVDLEELAAELGVDTQG